MADNVIGCAVERAVPAEEAATVARDYAAPALAGARGADEVGRRGEAQEHQLEKIVQEDVNLGRRRGSPPGILAAAHYRKTVLRRRPNLCRRLPSAYLELCRQPTPGRRLIQAVGLP